MKNTSKTSQTGRKFTVSNLDPKSQVFFSWHGRSLYVQRAYTQTHNLHTTVKKYFFCCKTV